MKNVLSFLLLFLSTLFLTAQTYDLVLKGGTVMDPATEFEGVRNVGIIGDRIATITEEIIQGKKEIDATGLVVSPGFIDLHVHGMTNKAHAYQVRDGVTTALELEGGVPFIGDWIASKTGNSIVNYGATACHSVLRSMVMDQYQPIIQKAQSVITEEGFMSPKLTKLRINLMRANYHSLNEQELGKLKPMFLKELADGALGIGVPVGYYPGAKAGEIFHVYEISAATKAPVFSHTRGFGMGGIHEAIANATTTGAPLHIVHANSLSLGEIETTLDMVAAAQERGLDVTTEVYPYTAASTSLESVLFDEGWQEDLDISYEDLQWQDTGERLTEETFQRYRAEGGVVIIHMMKPEWIIKGIQDKRTMIGSDGMPYAPGAHPRTAGTFSRVLGRYVREQKALSLMEALKKMTIMPAQRLEAVAPMMRQKGRLQVGTDADITVFDPATIIDKADFDGLQYSEGVKYVVINGHLIVNNQKIVENIFPGEAIVGKYKR